MSTGLQLQSRVDEDGRLTIQLAEVETPAPRHDEVLVRIQAAPLNPSDLGLLLAGADPKTLQREGDKLITKLPPQILRAMRGRVGQSLPVGNEGAGTVVAAGADAQALLGKTVGIAGGATYAEYRVAKAAEVLPVDDVEAGAAWFVNPMTALGMVETMRKEGHHALVHTAAASNLGQMLIKLTRQDGIPLVNIVRRPEQVEQLRALGAEHVVNSSAATFMSDLIGALTATGATLAFDAIGGGKLAGQILSAMEVVASRALTRYSRYGSSVYKQVYIYGALDRAPTELARSWGFSWGVNGWLLPNFLAKHGAELLPRFRARIASELKTTFASHYTRKISLQDALEPEHVTAYAQHATGGKYLITPAS
jgi:NADPH:quinone reductase-like Zn-dependent oxidoreductase